MFKRRLKRALLPAVVFFCLAGGQAYAWHIEDYDVEIKLDKDAGFTVTEKIAADFGYESKHGIYRDLPVAYSDENGRPYNVRFEVLAVRDGDWNRRQYVEEHQGNYRRIKIGSPDWTVSGRQTYAITYRVSGAILFLPDHDELYWNAVGPQWDVNIDRVQVALSLPEAVSPESLRVVTYTGRRGSRTSSAESEVVSGDLIAFKAEALSPYEGFTIVVGLPKGILTPPSAVAEQPEPSAAGQHTYSYAESPPVGPWALAIPVAAFFIMFNLWQRFGKDPQLRKSIVVEYKAPDGLKPAEIGTLIDHRVDQRDITATLIDLAVQGYVKIVQQPALFWRKEYTLILLKDFAGDAALRPYEKRILRGIFGGSGRLSEAKLSELGNKFYKALEEIKEKIREGLRAKKYLGTNPVAIIAFCLVVSFGLFFLGVGTAGYDIWLMTALITTAAIVFLFGLVMPRRTLAGTEAVAKILGFKEFLIRTERDKILEAEQQDIFERMLPYAICLGVSTKWAKKFDGLYTQPPQWFAGDYGGAFVYGYFIRDLDRSLSSMGSSLYSSPQGVSSGGGFSGGGSSGGGFGGGGGGSW